MTTERRWYEPPARRDWHPDRATLKRIESANSLRRSVLDRTAAATLDRTSLRSSSSGSRSDVPSVDRSLGERRSLRSVTVTPTHPSRPPGRDISLDGMARGSVPSLPRSVSSPAGVSLSDMNATYVLPRPLWCEAREAGRSLSGTPTVRPRSSSISKYAPLPAIPSASKDTNNNNNQEPQFVPPPLVRSRTFDVLDTSLNELPVVEVEGGERGGDDPCLVTVSIEGKTLADYLSHARDGLLRSRPATRYGRPKPFAMPPLPPDIVAALPSALHPPQWSPAQPNEAPIHEDSNTLDPETPNVTHATHEEGENSASVENQAENSTADILVLESEDELGDSSMAAPTDNTDSPSKEEFDSDDKNNPGNKVEGLDDENDNDKDSDKVKVENRDENQTDGDDNDRDMENNDECDGSKEGYDSDDEDDDEEDSEESSSENSSEDVEEIHDVDAGRGNEEVKGDEDINVYFKLPDDSLLVASSSPQGTLGRLLGVVERTRVGGKRLELIPQCLDDGDLDKTLAELGILNNTVIYLLRDR